MRRKIHDFASPGFAAVLAVVLAGCATVPPPIGMMDRAQSEIRAARNLGAANSAPDALADAERRLAAAQQLSANNDNRGAAAKAQEAEAAAATARARAQAAALDEQIRRQVSVNQGLQADLKRRLAAAADAQQGTVAPASPATSGNAPVMLPSIQLGQPVPAAGATVPAPATTAGGIDPGVQP